MPSTDSLRAIVLGLLGCHLAGCGGGSGGGGGDRDAGPDAISCESDEACPPGQVCEDGRCRVKGGPGPDGPVGTPDIVVTPTDLDFGSALLGIETCLEVEIANAGDAPLEISGLSVEEDDEVAEFILPDGGDPGWVVDEGTQIFDVCFVAVDDRDDTGRAIIASNDPDEAEVEVDLVSDLKGEPLAAWCVLGADWEPLACPPPFEESPSCTADEEIDLSTAYGTPAVAELGLWNGGTENRPLRIDALTVSDDLGAADQFALEAFRLDDAGDEAPVDLAEGPAYLTACTDVLYVRVTFTPADGGWVPAEELRIGWVDEDDDPQETAIPFAGLVENCPPGFVDVNGDPDDGCEYPCKKAGTEACDGIDNDCNGETDEGYALGVACDGGDDDDCPEGVTVCAADGTDVECDDATGDTAEFCDGVDNDCDGAVDDGFSVGAPCDGGDADLCAEGTTFCDSAGTGVECTDTTGDNVETCNGADDDCDGTIDEDFVLCTSCCDSSDADLCDDDSLACDASGATGCVDAGGSIDDVCDGADNDCDGTIDDGANVCGGSCALASLPGAACDFVGAADLDTCSDDAYACAGLNATACADTDTDVDSDGWSPGVGCGDCDDTDAARYPGAPETCNAIDDDCDGTVDDGTNSCGGACTLVFAPGAPCDGGDTDLCLDDAYTCAGLNATTCPAGANNGDGCNGADDDCDGTIDNDGSNACGGSCTLATAPATPCDLVSAVDLDTCTDDAYACAGINATACANTDTDLDNDNWSPGAGGCGDCDDTIATRYPGATETCNTLDDDCDGTTDEGTNLCGGACALTNPPGAVCDAVAAADLDTCTDDAYACAGLNATTCTDTDTDADNDNWSPGAGCGDCDDSSATRYPGATETCNTFDDDCDGTIDDGTNACGGACVLSPAVGTACDFVGAADLDTCTDDAYACADLNSTACANTDTDLDNDNYSPGAVACGGDCNDGLPSINPGASEICDTVDNDCDGTIDEGTNLCGGACTLTFPPGTACDSSAPSDLDTCTDDTYTCATINSTTCSNLDTDLDNDNYSAGAVACNGDCDDSLATRYPGAPETCNTLDDDCDGTIDEGTNACGGVCVLSPAVGTACDFAGPADLDTCTDDSYTCADLNTTACTNTDTDLDNDNYSPGAVACSGDCDDGNAARNPGAAEACDTIDNDCDGTIDDGGNPCGGACPVTAPCSGCCDSTAGTDLDDCLDDSITCTDLNSTACTDFDTDADNDNWSLDGATCTGDCNDGNAAINPGLAEVCGNGLDDNCAGGTDTGDAACACAAGECGGSGGSCSCAGACLVGGDCCENACSVCGGTATFLSGGTDITGGVGAPYAGDTAANSLAMSVPVCAGPAVAKTDWYRFTLSSAQMIALDTFTSGFDTVLSLHSGSCGAAFLDCDDDSCATAQSGIAAHLAAGTYFVAVKPKSGSGGAYSLMYEPSGCGEPTAGTLGVDLFEIEPPVSAVPATTLNATTGSADNWFMGGAGVCNDGAEDDMYFFHGCPGKFLEGGLCGSGYDTVIGMFEGDTTCAGAGWCNDDSPICGGGSFQSFVTSGVAANRGLWFYIVDGYYFSGADGAYTLSYRFIP